MRSGTRVISGEEFAAGVIVFILVLFLHRRSRREGGPGVPVLGKMAENAVAFLYYIGKREPELEEEFMLDDHNENTIVELDYMPEASPPPPPPKPITPEPAPLTPESQSQPKPQPQPQMQPQQQPQPKTTTETDDQEDSESDEEEDSEEELKTMESKKSAPKRRKPAPKPRPEPRPKPMPKPRKPKPKKKSRRASRKPKSKVVFKASDLEEPLPAETPPSSVNGTSSLESSYYKPSTNNTFSRNA